MKKLDKRIIENVLGLTPMQEGILYHFLKDPQGEFYFEQLRVQVSGAIDWQYFERAWNVVVETNEMLRTVFRWEKVENPVQIILKEHKLQPAYYDLWDGESSETRKRLEEITAKDSKEKFDLRTVPFRVTLCKISGDGYEMIISNHHILFDGWSSGIILKEFFNAYHGLYKCEQPAKPSIKAPFKEFIKWIKSRDKKKQELFWREYLTGVDSPTELPLKRITKKSKVENYSIVLEEGIREKLDFFARNNRVTLASVFYTAWGILLQKYCGSDDVVFGTTVSGRSARIKGIESMVGLFINTIPLRVRSASDVKMIDIIHGIETVLQERVNVENTPLVDIGSYSPVGGSESLFDHLVVIENYPLDEHLLPADSMLSFHSYAISEMPHYDLTVDILPFNEIEIKFICKQDLFNRGTIENLAEHFKGILGKTIEYPGVELSQLEITSSEEKNRILYDFNDTSLIYPKDKTLPELFVDQVLRTPDRIAVIGASAETIQESPLQLSYRQLSHRVDKVAGLLTGKGIKPDTIVGIMVKRSIEMMVGILGILKCGGAYLPIDPEYPEERIGYMVEDSNAALLLTGDIIAEADTDEHSPFHPLPLSPSQLCYIIYTSGSTGRPKGVMVKQEGFLNLLYWYMDEFQVNEEDNILLMAPVSFDLAQKNLFSSLFKGGRLTLAAPGIPDYNKLSGIIQKERITLINCAPSVFYPLVEFNCDSDFRKLTSLREIVLGGEPINTDKLLPWVTGEFYACEIVNTYGPTECTDIASSFRIPRNAFSRQKTIPIGKPLPNVNVFVLDKYFKILPVGIVGELYIGGIGLAKGYYNNSQLTGEKFLRIPDLEERIVYRTGDLGHWLPDGNIEFSGRIDHQVKVRGLRIELAEVEHELSMHEEIKDAVVTARRSENGDNYLCGYMISGREIAVPELREYLGRQLPDYMIPTFFVRLERIPLTPSGKVDRSALPEPEVTIGQGEYEAPRKAIEKILVGMYSEVLGIEKEKISIHDNFFHLGGHSLKAARLAAKVHKKLDVNVPLPQIFETSTISGLAEYITQASGCKFDSIEPVEKRDYYPLSSAQNRLYVIQQMVLNSTDYNMPAVFEINGRLDKEKLQGTFQQLITRHESLRTSFHMVDGDAVQWVHEENVMGDWSLVFGDAEKSEIKEIFRRFIRPFDLSRAPLLRTELIRTNAQENFLMVDMHHIISDGASVEILLDEFLLLYEGKTLSPLEIQYKDYAGWQNSARVIEVISKQESYWLDCFKEEISLLNLPFDFPLSGTWGAGGSQVIFEIGRRDTEWIKKTLTEKDVTLYILLLSVFNILLSKYTGQEDILIGTVTSGRTHGAVQHIIGLFPNFLPMRNFPGGEKTIGEFLEEVKGNTMAAFENQDYPYEELVKQLNIRREPGRDPMIDAAFTVQNMNLDEVKSKNIRENSQLKVIPLEFDAGITKWALDLFAHQKEETIGMTLVYSSQLFRESSVRMIANHFVEVLRQVLEDDTVRLKDIRLYRNLSPSKKSTVVEDDSEDFQF